MRTIQLLSEAFNMNNKKIGRDVIQRAEELHLIPEKQSGSRKNRQAVLKNLKTVLVTDISRQLRLPKAGTYEVETMRTIQILSTAFNRNNKKIGRDVIQRAEELHLIPEEQSGSQKNRQAILTVLNKVLVTNISRQLRVPSTVTSNDTKPCYDRIVLWMASLLLQRICLGSTTALSITNNLQSTTHNIKIACEESTQQ